MRNWTRGAAVAIAGLAGLVLAGCGAGQDALTSRVEPSVPGVAARSDDGSVLIRNAFLRYGAGGYPAGGAAPVDLAIVNETPDPIRLVAASSPVAESVTTGGTAAGAAQEQVVIPPNQVLSLTLRLTDLTQPVRGVGSVPLSLRFDNGAAFSLEVPVAPPVDPEVEPEPRVTATFDEEH